MDSQKTSALEVRRLGNDRITLEVDMTARPLTQEHSRPKMLNTGREFFDPGMLKADSLQYGSREVPLPESMPLAKAHGATLDTKDHRSSTKEKVTERLRINTDRGMER